MDVIAARALLNASGGVVVFTGAGISTESGIPDFRSPNGVWARNRTIEFGEFVRSQAGRIEYWRQKREGWPAIRDARPNTGHLAIVEMERRGQLQALITQNIDGLHQRAGNDPELVIELHGTTTEAGCLTCGKRIPMEEAMRRIEQGEESPQCTQCGGLLKPATISFGQAMPEPQMRRAAEAARTCEVFLSIGSSLVVHPAAMLPVAAKRAGARLIIINRTPTPLDDLADLVIHAEIGSTLPKLIS